MSGPWLAVAGLVALCVTAVVGSRVPRGEGYLSIDLRVQLWVTYGPGANLDRRWFSATYGRRIVDWLLGSSALILPLAAAVAGVRYARRYHDRRGLWATVLAVPVAPALTELVLKPVFGRRLEGALAYPSGAATTITMAVVLAGLIAYRYRGRGRAIATVAVSGLVALLLALLLISRQWHYFSDLIGGVGVGIGVPCLIWGGVAGSWHVWRPRTERPVVQ